MKKTLMIVAALALALSISPFADAASYLIISNGSTTKFCDNSTAAGVTACTNAGFFTSLNSNQILFLGGSVGGYSVATIVVQGNQPGTATVANSIDTKTAITNVSAGNTPLYVGFASSDFVLPSGNPLTLSASHGGTFTTGVPGDKEVFIGYGDAGNTLVVGAGTAAPTPDCVNSAIAPPTNACNGTGVPTTFARSGNFSLSGAELITLAQGDTASFTATVAAGSTACTGSIGDFVWDDLNHNGIQDAGEPGIGGVLMTLGGAGSGTTTTAANGFYQFSNLCAGTYTVTAGSPGGGYVPTITGAGTLSTDSNPNPSAVILTTNSSSDQTIDFGFFVPCTGSIGDFVWDDLNHNGIQDAGEPGIGGVLMTLGGAGSGTTTTAANGFYQFSNLCAGTYTVTAGSPGGGYVPTITGAGTPSTDSNPNPSTVTLTTNSSSDQTVDFGFFVPCGSIGDFVWNDVNKNGIQDASESGNGIPGITVELWKGGVKIATTTTDAAGLYHFTNVCEGDYVVIVPSQGGLTSYTSSPDHVGSNAAIDSNGTPAGGPAPLQSEQFHLAQGENNITIDFGFFITPPHLKVQKTPDGGVFTQGTQVTYTIVVTNDGGSAALNPKLNDQLPSNGGLTWTSYTSTSGTCTISASNFLHCDFAAMQPGDSVTVTVSSPVTTPMDACQSQPNPAAIASADNAPSAQDSGSLTCIPSGKSFSIGPSSMEGAIKISAGDWVNGGYSFKLKSAHSATQFSVTAEVVITGPCLTSSGQKIPNLTDTVTVPLGTQVYAIPASTKATDWLPTGDANSILSWQGSIVAPAVCGGSGNKLDASKGAVYNATVSQNPSTGSLVDFRFKYRDPAAKGKPNTNCLDATDPNRNKADVCGASWSQTITDP